MTLVRKGLLSTRGYHYAYTGTLLATWLVGLRNTIFTSNPQFGLWSILGYGLFRLRRRRVSKYALWVPVILARLFFGDNFIDYTSW